MKDFTTILSADGSGSPEFLLILPVDAGGEDPAKVAAAIKERSSCRFLLAAFPVEDWNRDLSPWAAHPVFGTEGFGGKAEETLHKLEKEFLPAVRERFPETSGIPVILGGYSLAGLFSLWSVCRTDEFAAAAGVSPSVWFPGWTDYVRENRPQTGCVYLSLGDREERTRNPVMRTVGDSIRTLNVLLKDNGITTVLEWNEGNHFRDPEIRCAKGFAWCMEQAVKAGS